MRKSNAIALGIILLSFILGVCLYPRMPEEMASHWNAQGQVNGYLPKFWGLFLVPLISVGLFLLFMSIPKIDPLKHNIEEFRKYYDGFVVLIILFLFYVHVLTILWNIGARFSIVQMLAPAFGFLYYYCGILIENAKRNWFIGIRTPWTLSSERVWEKTHKIGGKLFKAAGFIAFIGTFFQNYALFFILAPIILVAIYTIVYSYAEYRKEPRTRSN
ncbi:MAG: SdpI family protein [Archaeoglobus sp.]|uniref:SdpI family protein n=1 Tax=Archaeoglobus sp. TaxID=1872626 RepID=UPI001DCB0972|nr:SdpI family protein [Archaeoglobus sp.]MBO8179896.1 SdpI family protein [Archaeoglobus sp.]